MCMHLCKQRAKAVCAYVDEHQLPGVCNSKFSFKYRGSREKTCRNRSLVWYDLDTLKNMNLLGKKKKQISFFANQYLALQIPK